MHDDDFFFLFSALSLEYMETLNCVHFNRNWKKKCSTSFDQQCIFKYKLKKKNLTLNILLFF